MSIITTRPASVADNIVRLDVGQSFTMSRLVAAGDIPEAASFATHVSMLRDKIASHFSRHLGNIRKAHPERAFEIETGTMVGSRNNLYVVGVITRVADRDTE